MTTSSFRDAACKIAALVLTSPVAAVLLMPLVRDGIAARLGHAHFWINTTSAGVERTAAAFEEWLQCEYTHLKVVVTPVTSRWGNVTVAGPKAWKWLSAAGFDAGFAPTSMKHMTLRSGAGHAGGAK